MNAEDAIAAKSVSRVAIDSIMRRLNSCSAEDTVGHLSLDIVDASVFCYEFVMTNTARSIACLISLIALSLGSCSTAPLPLADAPPPGSPSPTQSATQPSPSPGATDLTTPTAAAPMTTINIYKVDTQCANLTPAKVTVTAKQSLEAAIAKMLAETDSGDFSIAGYRVSREGTRAIVDFRLPANSKRSFYSLSSCEQLALFGGIRKTLINNAQWKIQSVQFTEKGQEIVL